MEGGPRIFAVITEEAQKVGGGLPIFYVDSSEEKERVAMYISRITGGVIHDVGNGTYIVVIHQ
ncbi:MAG: capping complex subunit for YIEGIA [Limnochordia bacterium]|nr:hypothetical protein [Bacillota bacterium]NMB17416.1 hypothetical protein [Bacillota bacterium]